jgi:hypothetical protein
MRGTQLADWPQALSDSGNNPLWWDQLLGPSVSCQLHDLYSHSPHVSIHSTYELVDHSMMRRISSPNR